ncbi:hypothetical protein DITRI_Ditri12bG0047300 [Diplodiscus trichospermus]
MGNCVTVYKKKGPAGMNLSAQIQSPPKEKFVREEHSIAELCSRPQPSSMEQETSSRDLSKTEENFLDSQPWLESDSEEFFSVNGDSTPSSGNSPKHQKSFIESPAPDKNDSMERTQDAVPANPATDAKKQLIDLFRESFRDDAVNIGPSLETQLEYKLAAAPYEGYVPGKEKAAQSGQCCLPSLVRNMSFGERKKRLSPAKSNGW